MRRVAVPVIAAAVAISACAQARGADGNAEVTRNFQVGAFDQLELAGSYDVEVRTGAKPSVTANGPEDAIERMEVKVRDNRLTLGSRHQKRWFNFGSRHGKVKVVVTVPALRAATLAGSGVIAIDKVSGERFDGEIAGSGHMKIGSIDVALLKLAIGGSGALSAASGRARAANYEIAGSGGIDARSIATKELKASIAGSGGIKAQATQTADISILGSGNADVTGGARCSVHKAGSGNVRCS